MHFMNCVGIMLCMYFLTKEDLHEMKHNYGMKEIWKFATDPKTHTARNDNQMYVINAGAYIIEIQIQTEFQSYEK